MRIPSMQKSCEEFGWGTRHGAIHRVPHLTKGSSGRGGERWFGARWCRREAGVVSPPPLSSGVRQHGRASVSTRDDIKQELQKAIEDGGALLQKLAKKTELI